MALRVAIGVVGLAGFSASLFTLLATDSDMRTLVNRQLPPERQFPLPGPNWRRDQRAERRQLRYSYGVLFPEGTLLQRRRLAQVMVAICALVVVGSILSVGW